ncbi:MAG: PilZ domain-containing protein [Acidobacteriaceae bacterium]|nr:PilZ domain-containing protein [Acidobacteriaceae bacterium]
MTLSSMLVSRDWPEVSVLECILGGLHVRVDVETELDQAAAKLAKSKIDALIVDCDLDGSTKFLRAIKQAANTVPLLIIGSARRKELKSSKANFVFRKPISVEQAVRKLSAARNLILRGRLLYHRQPLNLQASVTFGGTKPIDVRLLNLSAGGMAISTQGAIGALGPVRVRVSLPEANLKLGAKGEIVWSKQQSAGIRFLHMTAQNSRNLQLWLAKQCLAE